MGDELQFPAATLSDDQIASFLVRLTPFSFLLSPFDMTLGRTGVSGLSSVFPAPYLELTVFCGPLVAS